MRPIAQPLSADPLRKPAASRSGCLRCVGKGQDLFADTGNEPCRFIYEAVRVNLA